MTPVLPKSTDSCSKVATKRSLLPVGTRSALQRVQSRCARVYARRKRRNMSDNRPALIAFDLDGTLWYAAYNLICFQGSGAMTAFAHLLFKRHMWAGEAWSMWSWRLSVFSISCKHVHLLNSSCRDEQLRCMDKCLQVCQETPDTCYTSTVAQFAEHIL